jgi:hypothetical protein
MEIQRYAMLSVYSCLFIARFQSFGIASLHRKIGHFLKVSEAILKFKAATVNSKVR